MCRRCAVVLSAAAMAATAFSAKAQDGDVVAGHAFARETCRACHMVDPEARAPRRINIGPAFRDIANTPGMTATAIRVFLSRQSRNQTGKFGHIKSSAVRVILDDPPIHIHPDIPAARGANQTNPVGSRHSGSRMIPFLALCHQ